MFEKYKNFIDTKFFPFMSNVCDYVLMPLLMLSFLAAIIAIVVLLIILIK